MIQQKPTWPKRLARFLMGALLFTVLTFVGAELAVRWYVGYLHRSYAGGAKMAERDFQFLWMPITVSMNSHFWKLFRHDRQDPRLYAYALSPLFDKDPKVPRSINAVYRLPSGKYTLTDFTRRPSPEFMVHINQQGFRGGEPPADLNRRVRVLCLGSYQTFGHGVSDEEAYPARLGAQLGDRYAVWNGGMQSVGLRNLQRRMKLDLDEVQPQIMVLETGFVDVVAMKHDVFLNPGSAIFAAGSRAWRATQNFFSRFYASIFGQSYLISMYSQKAVSGGRDVNLEDWKARMKDVLDENSRRGIFTILTDPISGGFNPEVYEEAVAGRPDAVFLNLKALLSKIPPEKAAAYEAQFTASENWIKDMPPYLHQLVIRSPLAIYKTNFSHPNPIGHELIAEELTRVIRFHADRLGKKSMPLPGQRLR